MYVVLRLLAHMNVDGSKNLDCR